jgi:hypothetical protein
MKMTPEQELAIQYDQAVVVSVGSAANIVLRNEVYEHGGEVDYSPWTEEEMNLLVVETAELLAGDGLDETDDS